MKNGEIVAIGKSEGTLTSENVKKVFSVDTIVKKHPITDQLHVIPISRPIIQQQSTGENFILPKHGQIQIDPYAHYMDTPRAIRGNK